MSIKKFALFIVVLMLGLFLAGCDFFGGEDVVVIDNTPTEVLIIYEGGESLNVAQTKQFTAVVSPVGATQTVTWAVDDEEVATISATGLLTAVSEGTVNVTATSTELTTITATVEFTVIETDVQKMDKINAVETGLKAILPAVITEDYTLPTYDADPDVLVRYIYDGSFHAAGTVFEYNPGPTDLRQTISVNLTYGGKAKTFDVAFTIAKDVNLAGITGSSYVLVGETTPLLSSLTGTGITWSSNNEAVATVNSTGVVTGVTTGDAVITISDSVVSYTFDITVIAPGNADVLLAYQAKNFIISNIPASTREDFDLPAYTGALIEYEIDALPVTSFIATQGVNNTVVTIATTVTVNSTVINFDVEVVVLAKTDDVIVAEALAALDAYLEDKGYTDAEFRATGNMDFAGFVFEGVTVTWTSDVTSVISNEGVYTRGNDDSYVPLQVRLNRNSQNQNRKFTVLAGGYSQAEKIEFMTTDEDGVLTDLMNGSTKSGVNLPSLDLRFGATITWTSSNTAVLNNDGSLVAPVSAPVAMTLNATITYYKGANNINNFVQTVEVPFTVNPFDNDV
ncbi:MAG: Ig-like domain-containing protein, partial [Bacilli bacterium]|nr:Ig-like domain-containing protein [Bacilli bacterium]